MTRVQHRHFAILLFVLAVVVAVTLFQYREEPVTCVVPDACEVKGYNVVWSFGFGKRFVRTTLSGSLYRETVRGIYYRKIWRHEAHKVEIVAALALPTLLFIGGLVFIWRARARDLIDSA